MEKIKSSDLKHTIDIRNNEVNCIISIRLNDECKNGHEDFSMTSDFWKVGSVRTDKNWEMGGCCHKEILKIRPDLKLFVQLHLNQFNGYPMYYFGNGFFHLQNMKKEKFLETMLVDEKNYDTLLLAKTEDEFAFLMIQIGNDKKWEELAKKGIAQMEEWTGKIFESKATKAYDIEKYRALKIDPDWFKKENVEQRQEQKLLDKKEKKIKDLKEAANKEINKIKFELDIKIQFLEMGYLQLDNMIIYSHSLTINLNWKEPHYSNYCYKFSNDDYNKILKTLKLPEGWSIELKHKY